jgi:hypothetical protein
MRHFGQVTFGKAILLAAVMTALPGMQSRVGNLETRMLASHNLEREKMGTSPLRWNDELAIGAQQWADYLSANGKFEHSPNVPGQPLEGENIWGGTPGAFSAESMVNLWIAEKKHFKPGTFPHNTKTGNVADVSHYTQLIWRNTSEVGCGLSQIGGEEILVCRYAQPGNVIGLDPLAHTHASPKLRGLSDGGLSDGGLSDAGPAAITPMLSKPAMSGDSQSNDTSGTGPQGNVQTPAVDQWQPPYSITIGGQKLVPTRPLAPGGMQHRTERNEEFGQGLFGASNLLTKGLGRDRPKFGADKQGAETSKKRPSEKQVT